MFFANDVVKMLRHSIVSAWKWVERLFNGVLQQNFFILVLSMQSCFINNTTLEMVKSNIFTTNRTIEDFFLTIEEENLIFLISLNYLKCISSILWHFGCFTVAVIIFSF